MKKIPVPLATCLKRINHGPLMIVTTAEGPRVNAAPGRWSMPVNDDPPPRWPCFGRQKLHPRNDSAAPRLLPSVHDWGARSGRGTDEIGTTGAALFPGERVGVPRLAESLGVLECRATQAVALDGVDLVLGEGVFAAADPDCFVNHRWTERVRTPHHFFWGGGISPCWGNGDNSRLCYGQKTRGFGKIHF